MPAPPHTHTPSKSSGFPQKPPSPPPTRPARRNKRCPPSNTLHPASCNLHLLLTCLALSPLPVGNVCSFSWFSFWSSVPLLPPVSRRGGNCSSVPRCQVWWPEKVKGKCQHSLPPPPPPSPSGAAAIGYKARGEATLGHLSSGFLASHVIQQTQNEKD